MEEFYEIFSKKRFFYNIDNVVACNNYRRTYNLYVY